MMIQPYFGHFTNHVISSLTPPLYPSHSQYTLSQPQPTLPSPHPPPLPLILPPPASDSFSHYPPIPKLNPHSFLPPLLPSFLSPSPPLPSPPLLPPHTLPSSIPISTPFISSLPPTPPPSPNFPNPLPLSLSPPQPLPPLCPPLSPHHPYPFPSLSPSPITPTLPLSLPITPTTSPLSPHAPTPYTRKSLFTSSALSVERARTVVNQDSSRGHDSNAVMQHESNIVMQDEREQTDSLSFFDFVSPSFSFHRHYVIFSLSRFPSFLIAVCKLIKCALLVFPSIKYWLILLSLSKVFTTIIIITKILIASTTSINHQNHFNHHDFSHCHYHRHYPHQPFN